MNRIPDQLLELQARFDQWRANRKYNREPIPDQLRDAALEMSRRYPSSLLRQVLKIQLCRLMPKTKTHARRSLHSSNGYRALALDESNHRSDCVLEQGGDAHMHVIWHQMTFNDLAFFLPGQLVKDWAKLPAYFPIKRLAAIFGDENNMIFAIPLRVGQALVSTVHFVLLLVCLIKPPNENNI
jgi:hypothetical protein